MSRKIFFLLISLFTIGFIYGALVGKYSLFPFSIIKSVQDKLIPDDLDLAKTPEYYEIKLDDYKNEDLDNLIKIKEEDDVEPLRRNATYIIFGEYSLPASLPGIIVDTTDSRYDDLINLSGIKKFTINMENRINSIGYIFNPVNSNNRLLIYHQGHAGDFLFEKKTISYYLSEGYTVYAFCMPLLGMNNNPVVKLKFGTVRLRDHNQFQFMERPLSYFLQPVISMINYAEENFDFDDITMIGISGGGWTTVMCSAIDTRIRHSISVAGSYPLYIRFSDMQDWGDYEQFVPEFYNEIDYLDLYILCATGGDQKRKFSQAFYKHDPCCFAGEKFKHYQGKIHDIVTKLGGEFEIIFDETNRKHSISQYILNEIYK